MSTTMPRVVRRLPRTDRTLSPIPRLPQRPNRAASHRAAENPRPLRLLPRPTSHRASRTSPEWQIFNSAPPFLLGCRSSNQSEIVHHLTNRDPKLVRIDDPEKDLPFRSQRAPSRRRSSSCETKSRDRLVALSNSRSSAHCAAPSSCAVNTSIARKRSPTVTVRGMCTSMYSARLKRIDSSPAAFGENRHPRRWALTSRLLPADP